mmetsp:Transcript_1242/g.2836  ORF Transcript_1242/g.2836 Transcript_1242/m.2836 type:complete len:205 (-) Transcript_1242:2-616(-)
MIALLKNYLHGLARSLCLGHAAFPGGFLQFRGEVLEASPAVGTLFRSGRCFLRSSCEAIRCQLLDVVLDDIEWGREEFGSPTLAGLVEASSDGIYVDSPLAGISHDADKDILISPDVVIRAANFQRVELHGPGVLVLGISSNETSSLRHLRACKGAAQRRQCQQSSDREDGRKKPSPRLLRPRTAVSKVHVSRSGAPHGVARHI